MASRAAATASCTPVVFGREVKVLPALLGAIMGATPRRRRVAGSPSMSVTSSRPPYVIVARHRGVVVETSDSLLGPIPCSGVVPGCRQRAEIFLRRSSRAMLQQQKVVVADCLPGLG